MLVHPKFLVRYNRRVLTIFEISVGSTLNDEIKFAFNFIYLAFRPAFFKLKRFRGKLYAMGFSIDGWLIANR